MEIIAHERSPYHELDISKINKTDVMVFHRALVNKTFWDCRQLFKEKIIGLVETVLDEIKKENT